MTAKDLTLNIAVDLGRLGRFAREKRASRVSQFIQSVQRYLDLLEKAPKSKRFEKTYYTFKTRFDNLKNDIQLTEAWSEEMYTWANILTHRAKLL